MIEFSNVSKKYKTGTEALKDVSLSIREGEFVFVVGASGAGKSTLIKILLGEEKPTAGSVFVNGYNLSRMRRRNLPKFRRSLGVVFQDFRLIPSMNVYDNVAFALRVTNVPAREIRERVPYMLRLLGLAGKAKSYPDELSGGEQQRVSLARALINNPPLIIADEPTGNIDPALAYEIVDLLKEINEKTGTTVIMVTHEHELVEHFNKRVIAIESGRVIADNITERQARLFTGQALQDFGESYQGREQTVAADSGEFRGIYSLEFEEDDDIESSGFGRNA